MKIHFIIHESFEDPAAIHNWAVLRGHDLSYSRVYAGEKPPTDSTAFDFLVIMGGPQSPATTVSDCPYFDAAAEIRLIRNAAKNHKFILGVCLGAQLIGEAYGAHFEHSPHKEIGVFPVYLTAEAKADPIFFDFPESFLSGHWHGDMPGLPEGAKLLAYSEGCPRQIIAYDKGVYGFQCHLEFTPEAIESMIENCHQELDALNGGKFIQNPHELRGQDYHAINQLLFSFLDRLFK